MIDSEKVVHVNGGIAMVVLALVVAISWAAYNRGKHDADAWYAAHPQCPPFNNALFITDTTKGATVFVPVNPVNGAMSFVQPPNTTCRWVGVDEHWDVTCINARKP